MDADKQRIDLLEEILDSGGTAETIKEHFVLVPIQDLPEAVKVEEQWGTVYDLGGYRYDPRFPPSDPDLTWQILLDQVAAIRFHHGQEMAEFQTQQRREALLREFMHEAEKANNLPTWDELNITYKRAINRIIELEAKQ